MAQSRRNLIALLMFTTLLAACRNPVEGLFFHPDRINYGDPRQFGLAYENVFFDVPDGSRLHGWFLRAPKPQATVLHLHGNAANVSNHLSLVAWMPGAGFNVLIFDYRGFGRSAGQPTLDGVVEDAAAALRYLRTRGDVDAQKLILFGQSLGGATALRLLAADGSARAGVRMVITDSSFDSYRGIAREVAISSVVLAPFVPLALPLLPGAQHDPMTAIAKLEIPVVVMHGTHDGVIPFAHGERLSAAARDPKRMLRVERGQHMDAVTRPEVRKALVEAMLAALTK